MYDGSPKYVVFRSWFTPVLSNSPIPHEKVTTAPLSRAAVGKALPRIVMDFCSGCSLSRNCSVSVVGSSLEVKTAATANQAKQTKKMTKRLFLFKMNLEKTLS